MTGVQTCALPIFFDISLTFEFDFTLHDSGRSTELGRDYPKAFDTDPDGQPDEDWEVFRGRVQMLMIDDKGDGFRVDQIMTYTLRDRCNWKIIRWINDPPSSELGDTWGLIKSKF